jgi:hypothetical protein
MTKEDFINEMKGRRWSDILIASDSRKLSAEARAGEELRRAAVTVPKSDKPEGPGEHWDFLLSFFDGLPSR